MRTTQDVNVRLIDFPNTKEKEMITENADGSFTIFLNARFSRDTLIAAYHHAVWHIDHADFCRQNVQDVETEAHQL